MSLSWNSPARIYNCVVLSTKTACVATCARCARALDRPARGHSDVGSRRGDRHALRHGHVGGQGANCAHREPAFGHVFVLRGCRGDLVKLLWSDGSGMCLLANLSTQIWAQLNACLPDREDLVYSLAHYRKRREPPPNVWPRAGLRTTEESLLSRTRMLPTLHLQASRSKCVRKAGATSRCPRPRTSRGVQWHSDDVAAAFQAS